MRRVLKDSVEVMLYIEREDLENLRDIAHIEKHRAGRDINVNELIRQAIEFVYRDNERLRESFRRARTVVAKRYNRRDNLY